MCPVHVTFTDSYWRLTVLICWTDTEVKDGIVSEARCSHAWWPHIAISKVKEFLHAICRHSQLQLEPLSGSGFLRFC